MMKPQIIVLMKGTDTSQGNVNAGISDVMRSTLGPKGMNKNTCTTAISNDAATMMKLLDIKGKQVVMKQGMMDKAGHGKTWVSKGVGRIGMLRGQDGGKMKGGKKFRGIDGNKNV